jgi:hypothetical protein
MGQRISRAKTKLEYCTTSDTDSDTVEHSTNTKTKSLSELQPPACLPVQASLVANSPMPRVPPKATVYAINDDDDEDDLSNHDQTQAMRNVLISDDLFENISPRAEQKRLENSLYIKVRLVTLQQFDNGNYSFACSAR